MRDEPAAAGVLRGRLLGAERELLTARIRRIAARLGYELLNILDTDTVTDLPAAVRQLDVDAVIAPARNHLDLEEVHRLCEVVFLDPGELHYRDGRCEQLDAPSRGDSVTEVLVPLYSQAVTSDSGTEDEPGEPAPEPTPQQSPPPRASARGKGQKKKRHGRR